MDENFRKYATVLALLGVLVWEGCFTARSLKPFPADLMLGVLVILLAGLQWSPPKFRKPLAVGLFALVVGAGLSQAVAILILRITSQAPGTMPLVTLVWGVISGFAAASGLLFFYYLRVIDEKWRVLVAKLSLSAVILGWIYARFILLGWGRGLGLSD